MAWNERNVFHWVNLFYVLRPQLHKISCVIPCFSRTCYSLVYEIFACLHPESFFWCPVAPRLFSVMAPKRLPNAKSKPAKKEDAGTKGEDWQFTAARFVYQAHLDFTKVLAHFGDKVLEYSMAHEAGTHDHTDAFLVFHKQQRWTFWDFAALKLLHL